jgi:hypothetical protein
MIAAARWHNMILARIQLNTAKCVSRVPLRYYDDIHGKIRKPVPGDG